MRKDHKGKTTFVSRPYIDDIIVYLEDWTTHITNLESVLEALRQAGLLLSRTMVSGEDASGLTWDILQGVTE